MCNWEDKKGDKMIYGIWYNYPLPLKLQIVTILG